MYPHTTSISIQVQYFASLREARGVGQEDLNVPQQTAHELYQTLKAAHGFPLESQHLRVALNGEFASMDANLSEGDHVVFIPPVAGG